MIRRTPRSTRTDTLFPYTTLVRSSARRPPGKQNRSRPHPGSTRGGTPVQPARLLDIASALRQKRSEERRVGQECVSTCSSRCSPYPSQITHPTPSYCSSPSFHSSPLSPFFLFLLLSSLSSFFFFFL